MCRKASQATGCGRGRSWRFAVKRSSTWLVRPVSGVEVPSLVTAWPLAQGEPVCSGAKPMSAASPVSQDVGGVGGVGGVLAA